MADANIRAVITAKDDASATLKKFGDSAHSVGSKVADVAKVAAVGLAAAGAAAVAFGYSSVKAYQDSENQLAQLNAVLSSTKNVAGVTADAAIELSKALQKTTKFSDEQVLSAENLLLTFTAIGKDIFPQATKTVLDMSTALGQDLKSSSVQLGKALQDPILGITALRRVGVNFSDAQKKVIENLVETGQKAKAQKLILEELNTEFGGSAEAAGNTFAGSLEKLKNSFNDVQESIGKTIVDALTPFAQKVANFVASDKFQAWLNDLIKKLNEELPKVIDWVTNTGIPFLKKAFDELWPVVKTVFGWISDLIKLMSENMWVFWGVVTVFVAIKTAMLLQGALEAFTAVIAGAKLAYIGLQALVGVPLTVAIVTAPALLALGYLIQKAQELKGALDSASKAADQNYQSAGKLEKAQWTKMLNDPNSSAQAKANAARALGNLKAEGFATGTNYASGGMAMVGEQGPELINLPRGSQVVPNNKVGGGTNNFTVNIGVYAGTEMEKRRVAQELMSAFNDAKSMGTM